jgi:toxin ParE1/3/4
VKPFLFHRLAAIELDEAVAYYEEIRGGLGLALHEEAIAVTDTIQSFPGIGAIEEETGYRHLVLKRFPYVLFYFEQEDAIWVVAFAHGKRKPGYWLGREV